MEPHPEFLIPEVSVKAWEYAFLSAVSQRSSANNEIDSSVWILGDSTLRISAAAQHIPLAAGHEKKPIPSYSKKWEWNIKESKKKKMNKYTSQYD